jgi:oligoendopeptidase F
MNEAMLSPWSLEDLYPAPESSQVKAALDELEAQVTAFESLRQSLSPDLSPAEFNQLIARLEKVNELLARLGGYANLSFAANTQDQNIQAFLAQIEQLGATVGNRVLFFELWWKNLSDKEAEKYLAQSGDYRYWLEVMRQFKPHTLSEAEEKIVNIKNVTGARALQTLYDTITNRYAFNPVVDGDEQQLTRGQLMVYARHSDPDLRARAYQELYRVYAGDGPILGQMYQSLVRDWHNEQIDLRHFATPISARNLQNDIPDQVVDTLLDVCQRNAAIFQRYFALKARLLGVPRLRRYDIYAPISKAKKTYQFAEAAGMVLDSFNEFEPRVAQLAKRVLDENHLDSEVRPGKMGGAFCATLTPRLTPWVLVNYQSRPEDVATLAHELGHAIHSLLAESHSLFTQHASLPLAETASTFGEMLLIDRLLANESDDAVRRDLLFRQVDDAYATILRQSFFALYERQAHALVLQGASIDDLSTAYLDNLNLQFGESIEIADEFRWEWVSIPHIYQVPFYVYAYSFGQLLVLSLYQQYKAEGEAFKPRYLELLSAGGSDAPAKILTGAGIDIYSPAFWQGGFDVIHNLVSQLEALPLG